jgi:acetyl-CoA synthetase
MSRTDAEVDRWLREYARRPVSVAEVLCDRWATYPREVEFVAELPKTPSGKVQRFLLRTRALPAGARSRQ